MAEDARLKRSTESFDVKNQSNNQSNQPQHPQQTIRTEKLLKETSTYTYNSIEYAIMDTSQQIVLDYLLSSEQGEILKRNGQELKKLKIGEKTYNFERETPISKRLITKFNKIRQTMDYKSMNWKRREALDGSILTRTKHSQVSKWDTMQPPPTNKLLSKVMSIRMPSQMSGLEASRYYSISNT